MGRLTVLPGLGMSFLPRWSNFFFGFLIRFLCPIAVGAILVNLVLERLAG